MRSDVEIQAEELLDIEEQDMLANKIAGVTEESVLYLLGRNYNWDDGFAVPEAIIHNPNCGLATALELFYLADGTRYLKDKSDVGKSAFEPWRHFVMGLYERIIHGEFRKSGIGFVPPLSKVQIYKLKKSLEPLEHVFIETIEGENLAEV